MFNAFETDIAAVQVGVLAPSSAKNHSPSLRIAQSSESNLPGRGLPESGFSRAISEFLPFVECKKPSGQAELEAIYRLRHLAYLREGALLPGAPELFRDTYDESDNCCTLGCYVSDRLASSIQIHLGTRSQPCFPAMEAFSDILAPMLDRGLRIIDPTRFVVDATATRLFPRISYATVRLCALAGAYYDADVILATVREEHQAYYRRLFGHKVLCEPRVYPMLAKRISLMALDYRLSRDRIIARYPFFRSSPEEIRSLFGDLHSRLPHADHQSYA